MVGAASVSSVSSAMGVEAERGGAAQELALPAHHVQRLRGAGSSAKAKRAAAILAAAIYGMEWMIS